MVLLLSGCWLVERCSKSALPVSSSAPAPAESRRAGFRVDLFGCNCRRSRGDRPRCAAPPAALTLPSSTIPVVDLHVDTPWKALKGRLALGRGMPRQRHSRRRLPRTVYPIYLADYLNDGHPRIADAERSSRSARWCAPMTFAWAWAVWFAGPPCHRDASACTSPSRARALADDITQIDRFIAARPTVGLHAGDNRVSTSATGRNARGQGKKKGPASSVAPCVEGHRPVLCHVSHMSDAAFADLEPIAARFRPYRRHALQRASPQPPSAQPDRYAATRHC